MNKINDFLTKHFTKIVVIMLVVLFFRSCGDGGTKGLNKRIDTLAEKIEVLEKKIDARATTTDLIIEGLKSEKRMIQSTDRKMLDVTRQSVIDTEIEKLEKSK
jgi:septal ring factor EnvC (AmiA/AmiB activator)